MLCLLLLLLRRAAGLPAAAGKLVGKVVDLNDYPWYLVTSERVSAGAFASREVLPMSSLCEKDRWCDLHLKRLQADPNATPKGGWSRVCAAPASNASRWTQWRADHPRRGCPPTPPRAPRAPALRLIPRPASSRAARIHPGRLR